MIGNGTAIAFFSGITREMSTKVKKKIEFLLQWWARLRNVTVKYVMRRNFCDKIAEKHISGFLMAWLQRIGWWLVCRWKLLRNFSGFIFEQTIWSYVTWEKILLAATFMKIFLVGGRSLSPGVVIECGARAMWRWCNMEMDWIRLEFSFRTLSTNFLLELLWSKWRHQN